MNGSAATFRPTFFMVTSEPDAGERGADGVLRALPFSLTHTAL